MDKADKILNARQIRRAIQIFLRDNVIDESEMMALADIYPSFETLAATKKTYKSGTIFSWGLTDEGSTQLWKTKVNTKFHESVKPDADPNTYEKIGTDDSGYPIWVQPLDKKNSYKKGDIVSHNGKVWSSDINHNMYEPGVEGWSEVTV